MEFNVRLTELGHICIWAGKQVLFNIRVLDMAVGGL